MNLPLKAPPTMVLTPPLCFGRCQVDLVGRRLLVDGRPVELEPRPFDLLTYLIRERHRVVSSQELLEKVWQERRVSAGALARAVMKLRRATDKAVDAPLIRTVPRVGYRFVAPLTGGAEPPTVPKRGITLALLPFDNATGDAALDWIGLGLMSMVSEMLARERRLSMVAMESLLGVVFAHGASPPAARAMAVRRDTGAQLVVYARATRAAEGYRLDFRGYGQPDVAPGSVVASRPIELAACLAQALRTSLFPNVQGTAPTPANFRDNLAAEAYARGLRAAAEQRLAVALNLFRMALDIEPGHPMVQLELLRALAPTATDDTEVNALAAELLANAERGGDSAAAARVHQAVGCFQRNRDALGLADASLELALKLAEGQESFDWTAHTLLHRCSLSFSRRQLDACRQHLEEARKWFDYSGNRLLAVFALNMDALLALEEGQLARFVQLSIEAARSARALRAQRYLSDACCNASEGLALMGRLPEAAAYAEEGFAATLAAEDPGMFYLAADGCMVYYLAGTPQASARLLAALEAVQTPTHKPACVWRARGHHAAGSGDPQSAARCFAAALQLWRESEDLDQEMQVLPWYIEALILAGSLEPAEAEILHAERLAAEGNWGLQIQAQLLRAMLAHRQGSPALAFEFIEQALAAKPAPLWSAMACADAAWLSAESGDAAAGLAWLVRIDASLAALPVVLMAQARVLHAAGDTDAACRTLQRCVTKRSYSAANAYFAQLVDACTCQTHGTIAAAALPRAPFLPSRLIPALAHD